ncbi:hypothetical protein ANCDUO_12616 [Ancylostoma duodenale]|uniref:Uncharacterized protein n=1 Tax=Ancylostoma duodenale TaxID=51022 RepID=A0A0C2GJD7_9BILA|nr:hypothetical protein ANCDUO_12616 [Ancylostoma duodenale]
MQYTTNTTKAAEVTHYVVPDMDKYAVIVTVGVVQALTLQSLVPSLSLLPAVIAFFLTQFGILKPQLFGYFIAPCLSIGPLIDPIITIYYVPPYRHFIFSTLLSHYTPSIASETNNGRSHTSKSGHPQTRTSQNIVVPI